MKAHGEGAAVMLASQVVALFGSIPDALVSVGVGLIGVSLARWVFVNRENRFLPRRQSWTETLPLTLVAMLITGVIVYDRELGLSMAAFTGLGVGWAAVLVLDILGDRILAGLRAGFAVPVPPEVQRADVSGMDGQVTDADMVPTDRTAQALDALRHVPGVHDPSADDDEGDRP